ncbi:MAG: cytidine deaminase [Candidatus Cryptobacteroides sp.]
MTDRELNISFKEYAFGELPAEDRQLVDAAIAAMQNAYSPYSHFKVGAAVRLSDGSIVTGSNQENAAYPSGLCAERTAMFAANAQHPELAMRSLAVAGGLEGVLEHKPASPCGACRQVMAQYQRKAGAPMSVLVVGAECIWKFEKVDDLLPFIFDSI